MRALFFVFPRAHILYQDLSCDRGMLILGSAVPDTYLPNRKDQRMAVLAHAPAPIMPVASAILDLHAFIELGAMPTAVKP